MEMIVDFYIYKKNDQIRNIEDYFVLNSTSGKSKALYCKCEGLEDKGKPKNFVTEKYADSERVRLYIPDELKRDTTQINLTMCFIGEQRQQVQQNFYDYIKERPVVYWDTARKRTAILLLESAVKLDEDEYLTSTPNICVKYTFTNLYGECPTHASEQLAVAWAAGLYTDMF